MKMYTKIKGFKKSKKALKTTTEVDWIKTELEVMGQ